MCVGILVAVIGAGKYFLAKEDYPKQFAAPPDSITERRLSISQARSNKRSNYNFVTNFIPGVGTITNPQDYLSQWKSQLPEME